MISGPVPLSTPPPRHLLQREQAEDAESSGSMEDRSHDDVDMDALAANIAEDVAARFVPFECERRTLLEDAPPAPPLPQMQDNRTSPFDAVEGGGQTFMTQVQSASLFLDWCREMVNRYDELRLQSPPEVQEQMEKMLSELAGKVQQGARVQAIGEASVEVAAHVRMSLK